MTFGLFTTIALLLLAPLPTGEGRVHAAAQPTEPAPNTQTGPVTTPEGTGETHPYLVDGFRSAHFGMTEAEVRKAIQADFAVKESNISKTTNQLERTTVLSVTLRGLVPDVETTQVSYILGYTQKRLIQVNLVWGSGIGEGPVDAQKVATGAAVLRNYFMTQGFVRDRLATSGQLSDGSVLLFRGADEQGRVVLLVYGELPQSPSAEGAAKGEEKTAKVPFARLSYIENPTAPDIFRIKPGQF